MSATALFTQSFNFEPDFFYPFKHRIIYKFDKDYTKYIES
jgi:hypothetical protein